MHACPICSFPCTEYSPSPGGGRVRVDCVRCGSYSLGTIAEEFLWQRFTPLQTANISGYIRENQGILITERDLAYLGQLRTPFVGEKAEKLLVALAAHYPEPGTGFMINCFRLRQDINSLKGLRSEQGTYPDDRFVDASREASRWMAASWAASPVELDYLLGEFLVGRGLLARAEVGEMLVITPAGWQKIDDLRSTTYSSDTGFVAMAFHPDLKVVFERAILVGVRAAGYHALRIDRLEHNNRIDDESVAKIRQTKFLIADFTQNRPGVYFEAGLAIGLDHRVIWTVRHDQLDAVHFDTRQYNFIRWKRDELPQFATALQNRIEATIGKGPLPPPDCERANIKIA